MFLELLFGLSMQTLPENGTWWDASSPHSFQHYSAEYGVGVGYKEFHVDFEDLGKSSTFAYVCGENCTPASKQYHFNSEQHPRGIWASWQPNLTSHWYGELGLGAFKPMFESTIGEGGWSASNTKTQFSPLVGVIYQIDDRASIVINARYINGVPPPDTLGKFDFIIGVKVTPGPKWESP